jgi:hypothetical protein
VCKYTKLREGFSHSATHSTFARYVVRPLESRARGASNFEADKLALHIWSCVDVVVVPLVVALPSHCTQAATTRPQSQVPHFCWNDALKQGPPQQVERHPSIGTAPLQSFRTTRASSCGIVTSNKSNVPRRAAPIANFHTNESRTMSVDQASSSDSFVNGGSSTRPRSGGTPAAGGGSANNGHSTAVRPGRNATGFAIDNDHNAAAAATSTTTTTRATEENANNRQDAAPRTQVAARKPAVESRQRVRTTSGTPRVLRPRTGDAASSNPPTTAAKTARQAEAGGASVSAGAPRKSSRNRGAPAAAPSGKPNKRRKKGSQPEVGQLVYAYYGSWKVPVKNKVRCPA